MHEHTKSCKKVSLYDYGPLKSHWKEDLHILEMIVLIAAVVDLYGHCALKTLLLTGARISWVGKVFLCGKSLNTF